MSLVLEGILCQALLPRAGGKGRALAMEILVPSAAIRNLIREDKVHQIYGIMQAGRHGRTPTLRAAVAPVAGPRVRPRRYLHHLLLY
jgi:Tfp pilus assembly pilus retraction ATPase PilT